MFLPIRTGSVSVQDRDGAVPLLQASLRLHPFIERTLADCHYAEKRVAVATAFLYAASVMLLTRSLDVPYEFLGGPGDNQPIQSCHLR